MKSSTANLCPAIFLFKATVKTDFKYLKLISVHSSKQNVVMSTALQRWWLVDTQLYMLMGHWCQD